MSDSTNPTPSAVKFGTDGWRGIIADDFTYANVRLAVQAIAHYVLKHEDASKPVCIGYDTRFGSPQFARLAAETLAAAGITVLLAKDVTATPALSYGVRKRGAAGGIMITSSHNPAQWNGVKYKASYGGSGSPGIIKQIESYLNVPLPDAAKPGSITEVDFLPDYIAAVEAFADLPAIAKAGQRFLVDSMFGAGAGVLKGIFERAGVACVEIRAERNPLFPGINPEPILPHIALTQKAVVEEKCAAGLITDGDADRIGSVDEHGNVVDAHKIFAILLWWLLERKKWPGDVTRAFNTTKMLDRIAAKYGRKLYEHGIGFKYVCDLMLDPDKDILIGGEESGGVGIKRHLPERDGILNALLLANVMADEGKTLGELVAMLQAEFGEHQYGRIDMHIDDRLKKSAIARASSGLKEIAGYKVLRVEDMDGIKFYLENPAAAGVKNAAETWLLLRASGTEPLLRVYCESTSQTAVTAILKAAEQFVLEGRALTPVTAEAKGMLFDLDGVLISSIGSATRCWKRWAKQYDVPDAENFVLPHGRPARDIVIMLRPDIDPDEGLRVIEDMEIEDVGDIQVLPGVRELLASLPRERWTIVTSCTRRLLDARLRAAGLPEPPKLITADMVSRGKPDPEPYLRGAEALGFAPEDCIVVEDAVSGLQAGVAAGCRVLAVLSSTPASELQAADWISQSLDGVRAVVDGDGLKVTIPLV